jgi:hypothetical protein
VPHRPPNPFIIGAPASASRFIGRREQINVILSQLANPAARGSSAISGERRIGKTSLLHYITSPEAAMKYGLPQDRFVFVSVDGHTLDSYVNRLGLQTFTEAAFWRYVTQFLAHFMQHASPLTQLISRIPGFEHLAKISRRSMWLRNQDEIGIPDPFKLSEQIAADGKLVVLLLDEFEWIINNTHFQRPILLNTLRSLINLPIKKRGFALITSSEKPLNALCKDIRFSGSPFPNSLVPVHLRPFSTDEAYELIDEYLKGTAVAFSNEDKDFAYDLSMGHPYWLQRVCFEMFNLHLEKAKGNSVQGTQTIMVLEALDYEKTKDAIMVERERDSTSYISIRERERETQPSPKTDLPPMPRKFKIFVSSTSLDLQLERKAVEEALHRLCTASFSGMGYFGSRPEEPKEVCLAEVSRSDVYVGIFAHHYGYVEPESGLSMTELEYKKAREYNIPCLIYMMDESVPVLPTHIEQEPEAAGKFKALKQDLLSKHAISFFTSPDNLATQIVADLNNLFRTLIESDHLSPPSILARQPESWKPRLKPTESDRLSPPPTRKLATIIRSRYEAGYEPYILILGSSLSLTPEVRRAVCESDDWETFWTAMERLSDTERRALIAGPLAELNLATCYRCLAELAQAGYFNIILTANIDDTLDNALRILPAGECQVLCHGQTSAQEIIEALSRSMPQVKAIKLRGDINAYKLPLTPGGQFELPAILEEVIGRLLSQDTILVGDIPYDTDIQRCIRKGDGSLWVVVPEKPRPGSFLYNAKQARPRGEVITGPGAEFGPFFRALAEGLASQDHASRRRGPLRAQHSTD